MSMVTFMYWYNSQNLGVETIDFVVAECSKCGLRVGSQCPDSDGRKRCAALLQARCRRDEHNTYVTSILDALVEA